MNMVYEFSSFFIFVVLFDSSIEEGSGSYPNHNCSITEGGNVTADIGWPYQITCSQFAYVDEYSIYDIADCNDLSDDDVILCLIYDKDTETLLLNESTTIDWFPYADDLFILVDDITENHTYNFEIDISIPSIDKCYAMNYMLNAIPFRQLTCAEYMNTQGLDPQPTLVESQKQLQCKVGRDEFPKLSAIDEAYDVNVTWLRNCSDKNVPGIYDSKDRTLTIPSVSFEHAGTYVCAATYNGMTRYINEMVICVQHKASYVQHTIKCDEESQGASIGQNVELKCKLRLGIGAYSPSTYLVYWNKLSNNGSVMSHISCEDASTEQLFSERIACYIDSPAKCFRHVPTEEEQTRKNDTLGVYLYINNLISSDYGRYIVTAKITLDTAHDVNDTVVLQKDPIKQLQKAVCIAVLSGGIFIVFLGFALILYLKWFYFHVYFKRYFGVYESDEREYGAYLTYHYSQELDTFAKDDTSQCVRTICSQLSSLGHKVYDEHQNFSIGMRATNLQDSFEKCHRVVIILTVHYIKDDWSLRSLQQAFQKMIDFKAKLIFIMAPGVKDYVKQHASTDDACRLIQAAMRVNYVIYWSKDNKFNSNLSKLKLEDAMPKLAFKKEQCLQVELTVVERVENENKVKTMGRI